ncbi:MAG: hypothetical protein NZ528_03325 [Caldilineales bacterium]|nr:hypothetical protein [Caldilineales bacterium]
MAAVAATGPAGEAGLDPWEALWAPYDEGTYAAALAAIRADDVVLDIGAGDLRLARRMAKIARRVIAWERQPELLATAGDLPPNLEAVCADARTATVPPGVTVAVLLMRHCAHFSLYVAKLRKAGCERLITNARWRSGVEVIPLQAAMPFSELTGGWYACRRCGAVGWKGDDPAAVNEATVDCAADVEGCPACAVSGDP